jgi:hypothetical protein
MTEPHSPSLASVGRLPRGLRFVPNPLLFRFPLLAATLEISPRLPKRPAVAGGMAKEQERPY